MTIWFLKNKVVRFVFNILFVGFLVFMVFQIATSIYTRRNLTDTIFAQPQENIEKIRNRAAESEIKLEKTIYKTSEDILIDIGSYKPESLKVVNIGVDNKTTELAYTLDGNKIKITSPSKIVPGTNTLQITDNNNLIYSEYFDWGVLVLNTTKSGYVIGETAEIQIAVLDNQGEMVCNAETTLKILSPSLKETILTTKDKTIVVTDFCNKKDFTLTPDYATNYKFEELGEHTFTLTSNTPSGEKTIVEKYIVKESLDYEITRTTATRIYPLLAYPVTISIKANKEFKGDVIEYIPGNFEIKKFGNNKPAVTNDGITQTLKYFVDLKKDEIYTIEYTYDAPDESPYIYKLGKVQFNSDNKLNDYTEERNWYIAVDAAGAAFATRLWSSGFELNSTTAEMEYTANVGTTPTISNSTYRSGSYALNTDISSGTEGIRYSFTNAADSGTATYFRSYIRITTLPSSTIQIMCFRDNAGTYQMCLRMTSGGLLQLYNEEDSAQVESNSSALSTGTWYRLEMEFDFGTAATGDSIMSAKIDGTSFARSTTQNLANGITFVDIGVLQTETANFFWDDLALNQDAFTSQFNWPGAGKIVYLRPNGNGTNVAWTNDYNNVKEVTPDDGGSVITCSAGALEDYTYEDLSTTWSVNSQDSIKLVEGWARTGGASTSSNRSHALSILNAGGGIDTSATTVVGQTAYYTDDDTLPRNALIVSYDDPGSTNYGALTTSIVDGMTTRINAVDCNPIYNVTAIWLLVEYVPAEGGRVYSSGFELQSITADMEWTTINSTPSIITGTKRSGEASMQINSLGSGTRKAVNFQFVSANTNGPYFLRTYLYITTAPSIENRIIDFRNSSGTAIAYITLDNSRQLKLYDEDGAIGSVSSALSTTTWYRIELKVDASGGASADTVEAKIDGTNFATSSTRDLSSGVYQFGLGGNLNTEAQTTGDWLFDDVALNQNLGSTQNSYPGAGKIVHLQPNGDGTNAAWTGTPTNGTDEFFNMDEITPNDTTDRNYSSTINIIQDADIEDSSTYSISATDDSITLVSPGVRFNTSAAATMTFTLGLYDSGPETKIESAPIISTGTTWFTNINTAPRVYPLTAYTLPQQEQSWTNTKLDSVQIGLRENLDTTSNIQVTTAWLLVEYKPVEITISGICKAFDETTDCTDTGAIKVAVGNTLQTYSEAIQETVSGSWILSNIPKPANASIITVFIDGANDTDEAVAVTKYDGSTNITGMKLYKEHLVIGSDDNQSQSNTDLGTYDNSVSGDEDIFFDVNAGALTVDSTAQSSTEKLTILSGNTFSPGGTVSTHDFSNLGTFTPSSNGLTVNGSYSNTGTATLNNTVTFTSTTTETISGTLSGSTGKFSYLVFDGIAGAWSFTSNPAVEVSNNFTITNGTVTSTSNTLTIGGSYYNYSVFHHNSGTVLFNATTTGFSVSGTKSGADGKFYNITFNGVGGSWSMSGTMDVDNNFTITNGEVTTSANTTISGNYSNSGSLYATSNTFTFNATDTGNTLAGTLSGSNGDFYNLTFNGSGGAWSFTSNPAVEVGNDFTITAGTVTSTSNTLSVKNNYSNSGTFIHNSGTVNFNATDAGNTIAGTLSGSSKFYNLTFNGSGGAWSFTSNPNVEVYNNFTITLGTVTSTSGILEIGGSYSNSGTFTHNSGTVFFDGAQASATLAGTLSGTSSFYNLKFDKCHSINSPIAYWNFSEGTGSTTADTCTGAHTGTFAGGANSPTWTTGKYGNGLSFDGDDYIDVGNFYNPGSSDTTLEAWIKASDTAAGQVILSKRNNTGHTLSISVNYVYANNTSHALMIDDGDGYGGHYAEGTTNVLDNQWHHIAGVRNSTGLYIYVDGILEGQLLESPRTLTSNSNTWHIGHHGAWDKYFKGDLDEVKMYNYARTQGQIVEDMNRAGGSWSFTSNPSVSVANDFTIVSGAVTSTSNTLTVTGNYSNSGTFTHNSGTVTFNATDAGNTIAGNLSGSPGKFYNLIFNGSGGAWSFTSNPAVEVANDLTITLGTLTSTSNTLTITGNYSNSATFTHNSGTVSFNATDTGNTLAGTLNGSSGKFYNLTFSSSNISATWSFASNPTVEVANNFNLGTGTLTGTSGNMIISGNADFAFQTFAGFTHNSGTITFNATDSGNTISASTTNINVYNVIFNGIGGAWSLSAGLDSVNIENDFTITNGNVTAPSIASGINLTIKGNYSNSGTFTHNSGNVIFIATDTGNTIAGTLSGANGKFYNLTFNGSGGAWSFTSNPAVEVANNLTITLGTLTSTSNTLTVTGNYSNSGTFTHNSGTVTFNATDAGNTIAGTLSGSTGKFNNLTFNGSGGAWSFTSNPAVEVANTFSLSNGTVTSTSGNLTIGGDFTKTGGTFTHNSGTVIFNDNTKISTLTYNADIIFSSFTVSTASKEIHFDNIDKTTIAGTFTINGSACNTAVMLYSDSNGNQFDIDATSTVSISYAKIQDSNAITALTASNSVAGAGGNNTNWTINGGTCIPIDIVGICKAFDETTDCGDTGTIKVAFGTSIQAQEQTTVAGNWSITGLTAPSANTIVTIYIDGAADTDEAVAVTKYDGGGDITGVKLYKENVVIGSVDNGTLSNSELGTFDNSVSTDEDIFFDVNAGALTVDSTAQSSTEKLTILSGNTHQPGGSVTTHDLTNLGNLIPEGNTITIQGSYLNSGTFTSGSSTMNFTGTTTETLAGTLSGSTGKFNNLTFNGSGGDWSFTSNPAVEVANDLTITLGTLTSTSNTLTVTGNYSNSGTFTHNSGTVTFNATDAGNTIAGTLSGSTGKFNNLIFNGSGGAWSFTSNPAVEVANDLTITLGTLTSTSNTLTITGDYSNSGTFTHNSGTVLMNAGVSGITLAGNMTTTSSFYNLTFDNALGEWTFGSNAATVANNFTITGGAVYAPSTTLTITGNYSNSGTFTHNSGTVTFNATDAGNTIAGTLSGANGKFNNLTFNGVSGAWSFTSNPAVEVANDMTINNGTVTSTSNTLTITGNYSNSGTFTHNSGTVLFNATDAGNTIAGTLSGANGKFNNLTFNGVAGAWSFTSNPAVEVANDMTITNGTVTSTSNTLTITGNYSNSGTFTNGSGTVLFNATDAGNTIAGTLSGANGKFNNLTFNGVSGSWSFTSNPAVEVANDMTITNGTVTSTSNTLTITGNYSNSGTFTHNSGTVIMNATDTGNTLAGTMTTTSSFYNLTFNGSGGEWSFDNNSATIANDITITSGSVYPPSTTLIISGNFLVDYAGYLYDGGGIVKFNATDSGNTIDDPYNVTPSFGNVIFDGIGGEWTLNVPTFQVNNLTITNGHLIGTNGNWISIEGSYSNSGSFTHGNTTVSFFEAIAPASKTLQGTLSGSNGKFYNLRFITYNGAAGAWSFTSNPAVEVANDLTIISGSVTSTSNTLTVTGNYSNSGTFIHNSGTVIMNATDAGNTIAGTLSGANGKFYNLTFNGVSGAWSFTSNPAVEVANDLTITNGTVTSTSNTLTITGNYSNSGTFTHNSGTVTFNATDNPNTIAGTLSGANGKFYNLIINGSGGFWYFPNSDPVDVDNDFTITAGTFQSTLLLTIKNNYSNSGVFTNGTGKVMMTATDGSNTLGGNLTGSSAFYDLDFNGSGGGWSFTGSNVDITNSFGITNGTVTAPSGTLTINGNFANKGSFINNGGTVAIDSNNKSNIINGDLTGSNKFNNLSFSGTGKSSFSNAVHSSSKVIGGSGNDYGNKITTDNSDNVLIIGNFSGTNIDFDSTGGTDLKSSNGGKDIFVSKYNSDGTYAWTRVIGGSNDDDGYSVTTDTSGNVYITGGFIGTGVDFDDSGGTDNHSSNGDSDIYITKYLANGNYGWTYTIGSTGYDYGLGIAADTSGNVYLAGYFRGSNVDFDGTGGSDLKTATSAVTDYFISKYTTSGSYSWTRIGSGDTGGGGYDMSYINDVAVDSSNNPYLAGVLNGTDIDLDGTGGSDLYSSSPDEWTANSFLTKYDSSGNYVWTRFVAAESDWYSYVVADNTGNVYFTSGFNGTNIDLDGTGGTDLKTSVNNNPYITKYASDGSYGWTRVITSSGNIYSTDLGIDTQGNVYVSGGGTTGTGVDFDGTSGTDNVSGGVSAYITKYGNDGSYYWTRGSTFNNIIYQSNISSINVDASGNIYTIGYFNSTSDLDIGPTSNYNTSQGINDIYFSKYTNPTENVEVANNFTITSGEVKSTGGTLTITGNYSNSGTFTHNSGTVTFNATDAGNTIAGTLSGSTGKFNNLTFNGVAGAWSFTSNPAVEVANDFTITNGSVTSTSNTLTVKGNYSNSGTFTHNSGTVTFNATDAGNTIAGTLSGANGKFNNLTFNGSGGAWSFTSNPAVEVANDLTITNGTLTSTSNTLTITGNYSNSGTFTQNSGTVTFNATDAGNTIAGTLSGSTGKFYNLTFNGSGGAWSFTSNPAVEVANNLTITLGTLTSTSNTLTVTGNYSNSGTFTHNSGTVTFNATDAGNTIGGTLSGSSKFYNLTFNGVSGAWSFPSDPAVEVANDFTITNGSVSATETTLTITGNYSNSGTFTCNAGTVIFNATDAGNTIAGTLSGSTGKFFELMFNGIGGAWSFTSNPAVEVESVFYLHNGTVTSTSGNLTIGSSFTKTGGTFTHNSGTVIFNNSGNTSVLEYNADIVFNNFTVATANKEMRFDETDKTTIAGTFTVNGSDCLTPVLLYSWIDTNQFDIDATGTVSINYAKIQDSNAITALTASNSFTGPGGNNTNWTINGGSCYSNTAPNNPSSLAQKTTGDVTITTGGWNNSTSVKFSATASDTDNPDTLYLCVEADILATSFSNTEDSCGSGVAYSGTPVTVSVTIVLTDAQEYHWQARVKDTAGEYSGWISYGGNAESARDVGIDTTAPTGGTVYDGTSVGVDVSFNDGSLSSLSANWSGVTYTVSGLLKYEYSIGTSQGATNVIGWTDNSTNTSVTVNSLTLQTSQMYFFNIRTTDNANNTATIYSNGQLVAPSLSFSLNSNTVNFNNLNPANSFSDTKTTVITTSTNAYNGYVIKAFETDLMRSSQYPSLTIPNFSAGSYAAPSEWGGSNYGFGYTSTDTSIQGSAKFPAAGSCLGSGTAPCYAPFASSGPGDIVADHTATVTGSPISNEQFTITYKVKTQDIQNAGTYSSTIVYTIVPQY